jgi:hypothetical protein
MSAARGIVRRFGLLRELISQVTDWIEPFAKRRAQRSFRFGIDPHY